MVPPLFRTVMAGHFDHYHHSIEVGHSIVFLIGDDELRSMTIIDQQNMLAHHVMIIDH